MHCLAIVNKPQQVTLENVARAALKAKFGRIEAASACLSELRW